MAAEAKVLHWLIRMVSKTDFNEGLANLKEEIVGMIDKSIADLRVSIIDNLVSMNKELQGKVVKLENVVEQLTLELQLIYNIKVKTALSSVGYPLKLSLTNWRR